MERTPCSSAGMQWHDDDNPWFPALILVVLAFLAYQPVWHAGFIWDDDAFISRNQLLRNAAGLWKIWFTIGSTQQYYPLVFSSLWAEYHLWGLQPAGYHLGNVLLHGVNAVLFWRVLRRLEVTGAWWVAAIFLLHPVQVESVAWITERKNVLSGVFYFLALLAYLRFQPLRHVAEIRTRDWRFYPLVIVLFLCALLSKTVTCSLPAMIALLVWWRTGRLERRDLLALVPLFVIGAAFGLMTASMEKHYVGASGAEWVLSFGQRCLLAGRALWFYAGKLFWPYHLTFIYPRWQIDGRVWWQYLFPAAAVAVLIVLWWLRQRIGKGPLVAVLCFAGTLAPALGFFDVYPFRYSFVADHFQYLASAGLITLAASVGMTVFERNGPLGRRIQVVAVPATLALLGFLTWRQGHLYRNVETLWRDTLAKNPQCWMAHNHLGRILIRQGKMTEAVTQYEAALRIKPDDADLHNDLGGLLFGLGKTTEALEHYEAALRIDPDFAPAHNNLGSALGQTGRMQEAISHYEAAVRINPDFAEAHNNLGSALGQTGRMQEAISHYEAAVRITPAYAIAHHNLANALSMTGNVGDAIKHYEEAVRIKPDFVEAHNNLALALLQLGRLPEARQHCEEALRVAPDFAEAHYNLGNVLLRLGELRGAIEHYEQVLRRKPDYAEAHNNLGVALLQFGKLSEARQQFEETLRLKPDYADARTNLEALGSVPHTPNPND